jgi:hypothetical protein
MRSSRVHAASITAAASEIAQIVETRIRSFMRVTLITSTVFMHAV